ncbi:MAG TPA: porin [Gemmataceae bacterium]|nr:porin [Gemmataceae bacterium]
MRLLIVAKRSRSGPLRAALLALVAFILTRSAVQAQPAPPADDTRGRIEQLERQVQELKALLQQQAAHPAALGAPTATIQPDLDPKAISKLVDDYLKGKEATKAAKLKADEDKKKAEGSVVGDDNKLNLSWDGGGVRIKSADEAFNLHIGGRLMTDQAWFRESPNLNRSPAQPAGSPLGALTGVGPGIGDLTDGFFLRRARFVADGTFYKTIDFKIEFDFENYNSIAFDESFVGLRDVPLLGLVRFGQMHVPFGLEAYTSSRFLPQLERSPLFDAFYQEFAPGIFTDTTFCNQRLTMQHMFHRIDNFSQFNGASFSDGRYAYSGRVSGLPFYEDEGRYLLHLGAAYQWRKGSNPGDFNGGTVLPSLPNPALIQNTDLVRFRSRQSIRDAVGLQGDNNRVIDTGNIFAEDVQSINGELMFYWGPFWVQSEACLAHVDNAVFPASSAATARGNLNYYGTYVQVGYFLTGENRGYDKPFGRYARVVPLENFFLVKDEDGHIQCGLGAWELTYRYAYVNLNDDAILGGTYTEHTVGLNWYWSPNIKFQLNYINGHRNSLPAGAFTGTVQGIGLRAALEF